MNAAKGMTPFTAGKHQRAHLRLRRVAVDDSQAAGELLAELGGGPRRGVAVGVHLRFALRPPYAGHKAARGLRPSKTRHGSRVPL
jgi:hypothetical protein